MEQHTRDGGRTAWVVANGKHADKTDLVNGLEALEARGWRVERGFTRHKDETGELVEKASLAGAGVVIAAGGDGTANTVVNALMRLAPQRRPALALLPLGTANDFARACQFPTDAAEVVALLDRPAVPIDLAHTGDGYFLNVASGGFPTEITAGTDPGMKRLFGGIAYLFNGLVSLDQVTAKPVRVSGGDFAWEGDAYVAAVGNGRQAGGGFRLCDRAVLDDGLLDLFIIPGGPLTTLPTLLQDLLASTSHSYEHCVYHRAANLLLEAPEGFAVNLDGEPTHGTRFEFRVEPRAIRMHLPADAPVGAV